MSPGLVCPRGWCVPGVASFALGDGCSRRRRSCALGNPRWRNLGISNPYEPPPEIAEAERLRSPKSFSVVGVCLSIVVTVTLAYGLGNEIGIRGAFAKGLLALAFGQFGWLFLLLIANDTPKVVHQSQPAKRHRRRHG